MTKKNEPTLDQKALRSTAVATMAMTLGWRVMQVNTHTEFVQCSPRTGMNPLLTVLGSIQIALTPNIAAPLPDSDPHRHRAKQLAEGITTTAKESRALLDWLTERTAHVCSQPSFKQAQAILAAAAARGDGLVVLPTPDDEPVHSQAQADRALLAQMLAAA